MAKSVVKNATKETIEDYSEEDIFDRLLDETLKPDVFDLREEQYEGMAPPLYDVDIGDITYEAPTKLPMESEGIRSIGLESGGNAGIETLKQTTIQLQEMPPDRNMTVLQRMMKQAGAPAQDPRLLAQVSQVLGRDV
jgi:hypothetical protein